MFDRLQVVQTERRNIFSINSTIWLGDAVFREKYSIGQIWMYIKRVNSYGGVMKRLALTMILMVVFCAMGTLAAPNKGPMKDPRDGRTYKTVQIGSQTWMAENLNYETQNSYCYANKGSNCFYYGRLYTWDAAKKACPGGWRLPRRAEFETLLNSVGGKKVAGKSLKSKEGWNKSGNGTDAFGFSALPAGSRSRNGVYFGESIYADFWSSTEDGIGDAYNVDLNYYDDGARLDVNHKYNGFSVRCLKN